MAELDGQALSELSTSEPSKLDWLSLSWSFWWRFYLLPWILLYGFGSSSPPTPGTVLVVSIPLVITLLLVPLYLRWLLKARFRGFRLALVRDHG